ncbi:hypothetical protein [Actinomadura chibensis]|uniref:Uncharacterized protein n=1 Tax=Actinomadura chibensis TaxID=392828 RepID=A0A5D0NX76_9ACTN|nr:hypothetical protein [Actinomadura chibensis]TYB48764.1 hypothetical protein FXF69_06225 [Actinomadura chibensis]
MTKPRHRTQFPPAALEYRRLVEQAPPLSPEQQAIIRAAFVKPRLGPVRDGADVKDGGMQPPLPRRQPAPGRHTGDQQEAAMDDRPTEPDGARGRGAQERRARLLGLDAAQKVDVGAKLQDEVLGVSAEDL